jgi:hypothetical protein
VLPSASNGETTGERKRRYLGHSITCDYRYLLGQKQDNMGSGVYLVECVWRVLLNIIIRGGKNSLKQNKISYLKIKNYKLERVVNFKYLGVILNEDNIHQVDLGERIKNANKTYFMLQKFFKNKTYLKN